MANWLDAYNHYLNDVPGCSFPLAAVALRKAAQEFCRKTRAWRVVLDPVMTLANLTEYEFDLSSEQQIVRVLTATINGEPLPILLPDQRDNFSTGLVVSDPFTFTIFPAPAKGRSIQITAVIEPSNTSSVFDTQIYKQHINTIALGAKAELFGMENQPFTNQDAAARARRRFDEGVDYALAQLASSYSSARPRVKAHFM